MFEPEDRPFKLTIGNIGRPLCYLQNELIGTKAHDDSFVIKGMYGHLVEDLLIFLIKASGIKVLTEQERVSIDIEGHTLNGVLDLILDLGDGIPTVWDIKSASNYSFMNKFDNINSIIKDDPYGYISQLWLYTEAKRKIDGRIQIGGYIAFDKSSGEIRVVSINSEIYESVRRTVFEKSSKYIKELSPIIKRRAKVLQSRYIQENRSSKEVRRADGTVSNSNISLHQSPSSTYIFDCVNIQRVGLITEIFKKKSTGRKYLSSTCEYCKFKFNCFPTVQLLPNPDSSAKNAIMRWYVEE